MVNTPHAQRIRLPLHIPPDATHAQDAEDLCAGIMAKRRRRRTSPLAVTESEEGRVKATQGAQDKEDGGVSSSIVGGGGDVGDTDGGIAARTGVHVDGVVAGSIVRAEGQGAREGSDEGFVPEAGDLDAGERAVDDEHIVELAGFALFDKGCARLGFWFNEFRDVGEGVPCLVGAGKLVNLA